MFLNSEDSLFKLYRLNTKANYIDKIEILYVSNHISSYLRAIEKN